MVVITEEECELVLRALEFYGGHCQCQDDNEPFVLMDKLKKEENHVYVEP